MHYCLGSAGAPDEDELTYERQDVGLEQNPDAMTSELAAALPMKTPAVSTTETLSMMMMMVELQRYYCYS